MRLQLLCAVLLLASSPAWAIGPAFDCAKADTPLQRFICRSPELARRDLVAARPFYARRQEVGAAGWPRLRRAAANFDRKRDQRCGISLNGDLPGDRNALRACLDQSYDDAASMWQGRLSGRAAVEEVTRPIEQHVALQQGLHALGFLPRSEPVDGVYGTDTRAAIQAWQRSKGFAETGFLDNEEAAVLTQDQSAVTAPATATEQRPQAPQAVNIIDFLVDGRDYVGKTVTITGCEFKLADTRGVMCDVKGGHTEVDSQTLDRESLRHALHSCTDIDVDGQVCSGDVTGLVTAEPLRGLVVSNAVIRWSGSDAAQASAAVPVPAGAADVAEDRFAKIVADARQQYSDGGNDLAKGGARVERARTMCDYLGGALAVRDWTGTVSRLSASRSGKGVLAVTVADGLTLGTADTALDTGESSLIEPGSDLYNAALPLKQGDKVRFSGTFYRSATDCVQEVSPTMRDSMLRADYLFRFSALEPVQPARAQVTAVQERR